MRFAPQAISVIVGCIALYFAMLWGFGGARILTSPIYGLDDAAFAHTVYGIARPLELGPHGILVLAASVGAIEAAVACIFLCHVMDRIGGLFGRPFDRDTLEAALIAAAFTLLLIAVPALIAGDSPLLRQHALHFILAGVVAILSFVERSDAKSATPRFATPAVIPRRVVPAGILLPPTRYGAPAGRWDLLRRAAAATA